MLQLRPVVNWQLPRVVQAALDPGDLPARLKTHTMIFRLVRTPRFFGKAVTPAPKQSRENAAKGEAMAGCLE